MGRKRLEQKLGGLLRRSEEVQAEQTEPVLHLARLTSGELELLDRLLAKYIDQWGELDGAEEFIWFCALLGKGVGRRDLIPSDLPPVPELPHPGSYTEEVERGGLFTARTEPEDPRLLEEEGAESRT